MKLVALLSGGIDSPVASYMMSKTGADIMLLHMDNGIYADGKEIDKVRKLADRLSEVTGKEFPLYVANHENSQTLIKEKTDHKYQCVLCKRTMMHVAREFAKEHGCSGIVMGDSLGQVASQTLRNIRAETKRLDFPVIRPLIGMDKVEIIDIARSIETYDISIIATKGCGIVPLKPVTEASVSDVLRLQEKIDFEKMVADSAGSAKRIQ